MTAFASTCLPALPDEIAPDGSAVRRLLRLERVSTAHFELEAGRVSRAVRHRTVDEIWYVLAGRGEIWRSQDGREELTPLLPGTCVSLPCGTAFQFRAAADQAVSILGLTVPPWPGEGEAHPVQGPWAPSGR